MTRPRTLAAVLMASLAVGSAAAGPLDRPQCVVPAKPGGGFDLTCALARDALAAARVTPEPLRITYMPGGIGAVAYNAVVAQRPAAGDTLVAFSGGSLLNLAQGKFGRYDEHDVRWVAGLGADYGAVVVAADAPYRTLPDLLAALKANPAKIVFGAGGTLGSQDWMKAVLLARAAGVDPKNLRFVAFEGGGDAIAALQGGHIHVSTGDAAETLQQIKAGRHVRILAVMAAERLPGALAQVPTAKEQGLPVEWPIIRGVYVGPRVGDDDYNAWADAFGRVVATPQYARLREDRGLYPFAMTGPAFDRYVKQQVAAYRRLVAELGLASPRATAPR